MRPQPHWIQLIHTGAGYTRSICHNCKQGGTFTVNSRNDDPLSFVTSNLKDPVRAFAEIAAHLTADRDPEHVAEHVAAAAMLVGLANNIEPGVTLLAEQLSDVHVCTWDRRRPTRRHCSNARTVRQPH